MVQGHHPRRREEQGQHRGSREASEAATNCLMVVHKPTQASKRPPGGNVVGWGSFGRWILCGCRGPSLFFESQVYRAQQLHWGCFTSSLSRPLKAHTARIPLHVFLRSLLPACVPPPPLPSALSGSLSPLRPLSRSPAPFSKQCGLQQQRRRRRLVPLQQRQQEQQHRHSAPALPQTTLPPTLRHCRQQQTT
jgi:hypothetical protein